MKEKQIRLRNVQDVLFLIGGRWRGAVLATLCESPKRFSEIKRALDGITSKSLTKELKILEENFMLQRTEQTISELSVVYELTAHGKTLRPLIVQINEWAVIHRKVVMNKA